MLAVLLTTIPFFALVLCGYVATRLRWLPPESIPGLNAFVLYFALPCLLFRFGATTPVLQYVSAGVVLLYLACGSALVAVAVALARTRGLGWTDAAFGALVVAFPNTGYLGVPLLIALLGTNAAGPAIVTILVDLLYTSSLCIALSRLGAPAGTRAGRHALRGVIANPMPWAILLGLAVGVAGITLPAPLFQTLGLLADAASPVALFTIGAVLARSQMTSGAARTRGDYVALALMKLLLHPLLVWSIGSAAIKMGLPLDPFAFHVVVLVAALPSASNVAMLAERFGADNGRIARIILVSTALAFLTFSGAVAWVR